MLFITFKKEFVEMNHVSRQKAKTKVEKDFYKLMNNSNFGFNCINTIGNCNFKPIFVDIDKMSHIRKHFPLFNNIYKDFFCPDLMKMKIIITKMPCLWKKMLSGNISVKKEKDK